MADLTTFVRDYKMLDVLLINQKGRRKLVGTGRFELPTPRTPSECSTRLSHVPTGWNPLLEPPQRMGLT
jgi:hypothetical protein